MQQYYAVVRRDSSDELQHHKYVHKEKKNGKWVYYYKDDMHKDDMHSELYKKTKGKPGSKYGTYEHGGTLGNPKYTIKVKKGNKLLTRTSTSTDPRTGNATKVRKIGKIEQGVDSVKKKAKKSAKKGKKVVDRLLKNAFTRKTTYSSRTTNFRMGKR